MIIEELLTLPPWVHFEGITFEFQLINDGGNEMRLVYAIDRVDLDSKHFIYHEVSGSWENSLANPINPPTEGFLILFEKITSDVDLIYAARSCWYWLQERGLLSDDPKKRYG
jgi:hypothetical protein